MITSVCEKISHFAWIQIVVILLGQDLGDYAELAKQNREILHA